MQVAALLQNRMTKWNVDVLLHSSVAWQLKRIEPFTANVHLYENHSKKSPSSSKPPSPSISSPNKVVTRPVSSPISHGQHNSTRTTRPPSASLRREETYVYGGHVVRPTSAAGVSDHSDSTAQTSPWESQMLTASQRSERSYSPISAHLRRQTYVSSPHRVTVERGSRQFLQKGRLESPAMITE
jgi:hypothetical protein